MIERTSKASSREELRIICTIISKLNEDSIFAKFKSTDFSISSVILNLVKTPDEEEIKAGLEVLIDVMGQLSN